MVRRHSSRYQNGGLRCAVGFCWQGASAVLVSHGSTVQPTPRYCAAKQLPAARMPDCCALLRPPPGLTLPLREGASQRGERRNGRDERFCVS